MSTVAAAPPNDRQPKENLIPLALLIIFGIFATTLPQPQVLGSLTLTFLMKDELKLGKEAISQFFFWCALFWYLKPFAGILTDAFPIFRTKRRWYLLISSVLASLSWIAMAFVQHTYVALLLACITINLFMVMASTVVGAILVEAGQRMQATGRLTSLRIAVQNLVGIINGPLGGALATYGLMSACGVSAAAVLSIFPIAWFLLREKPAIANADAFSNAGKQLRLIGRSKTLWIALGFILLFYFSPGFVTVLRFHQKDDLHFAKQQMGNLGIFSGLAGMLSAGLYGVLVKRLPLRVLLFVGVATASAGTLFYLWYNGWDQAIAIESQNGFFFTFAELAIMDLAARAAPKTAEGMAYGLMLSLRNAALSGADIVGSALSDHHWAFSSLVYLNAGTTAIVLFIIPILPKVLVASKDSDIAPPLEAAIKTIEVRTPAEERGDDVSG